MIASTRRMVGAGLALLGTIAVAWSAFVDWYGSRKGTNIRFQDLFNGITTNSASTFTSLFIPLGVAALLTLIGIVVQYRALWVIGGVIALATAFLWGLRQTQTILGLHAAQVGPGPWLAAGGGALMLVAASAATRKARRAAARHQRAVEPEPAPARDRIAADQPAEVHSDVRDEWTGTEQAYQKGYSHGMDQASEDVPESETLGRSRPKDH